MKHKTKSDKIAVRAIKTQQKNGVDTFAFFLPGSRIFDIAEISRIARDEHDKLRGFQRKEIRNHVKSIVDFLDQMDVLFPNAIILALGDEVEFKQSRGPSPTGLVEAAHAGTLFIPIKEEGNKVAWIVDGQQRSLALANTKNKDLPIPIVAFVSRDLETQREQFILVNKARPLNSRLINELLPEVDTLLPRDLAVRKIPSELVNLLNSDPASPFHRLIRRISDEQPDAVIIDSALVEAIKRNLRPPMGALNQFKGLGSARSNTEGMYQALITFWSAVQEAFPEAWGLPPTKSRLMHSAGIRSMGSLMDQVMLRADGADNPVNEIKASLSRLAPYCAWVSGEWPEIGLLWNEIQSTPAHISRLSDYLSRLDRELSRKHR